jgi:ribokinase
MILVFGSVNLDLVTRVSSIPRPGETVLSPGYTTNFGGKGANQAVAAARASAAGGVVCLVARVGTDAFGASAQANLRDNGVGIDRLGVGPEPTGCAFITVDERGENAITVASGANLALKGAAVPADLITGRTVLVLQMEVPYGESLSVAQRVRAAGGRVIWNFAPVPAAFRREDLRDLLAATDFLVVNEHEAVAAAAVLGFEGLAFEHATERLARAGNLTCVATAGADGATMIDSQGNRAHFPASRVVPIDTTGAGDTFVGILATGLAEDLDLATAMLRSVKGASLACLVVGAQPGMPYRHQLEF